MRTITLRKERKKKRAIFKRKRIFKVKESKCKVSEVSKYLDGWRNSNEASVVGEA